MSRVRRIHEPSEVDSTLSEVGSPPSEVDSTLSEADSPPSEVDSPPIGVEALWASSLDQTTPTPVDSPPVPIDSPPRRWIRPRAGRLTSRTGGITSRTGGFAPCYVTSLTPLPSTLRLTSERSRVGRARRFASAFGCLVGTVIRRHTASLSVPFTPSLLPAHPAPHPAS
eukprot:1177804-Prorocentrum_minimum.AAC.3